MAAGSSEISGLEQNSNWRAGTENTGKDRRWRLDWNPAKFISCGTRTGNRNNDFQRGML